MEKKKLADLSPVARTLLIPLAYRAIESRRLERILYDPLAVELLERFDEPIVQVDSKPGMEQLATMLRARRFDQYARWFLEQHPDGMVVDLGCGLDTRFERIDNGQMLWFGLDFPEVIAIRCELLPQLPRCRLIPSSALDFDWMDCVAAEMRPVIFLAEGLFPYFTEAEARRLLLGLSERFLVAELVFDVISRASMYMHRFSPSIRKAGVKIGWGLDDSREVEPWGKGIRLVKEDLYTMEDEPRLGKFNHWVLSRKFVAMGNRILVIRWNNNP